MDTADQEGADQEGKDGQRHLPSEKGWKKVTRGGLQVVGGAIPFAGGLFSAAAGFWSEAEQKRVNEFLRAWVQMLEEELREKQATILEIMARIDIQDEKIAERVKSNEYQSLLRKAFRNWAGAESKKKREYIRNILSNAASAQLTSDDVVHMFLDWLHNYSEFHFSVIGEIYRSPGSTRFSIWRNLGKGQPREDSADADLYKLLFRDLSTGGIIRQHREKDYLGNFVAKNTPKSNNRGRASDRTLKSAFDDEEQYELTSLGQQFVHYAMTEIPNKIEFQSADEGDDHSIY